MPQEIIERNILHYPQLDTILMVEDFIRENSGEFKKKSLWENLPRKMIYQTFCVIFDYLLESGKIAAATVDNLAGSGMAAYARNHEPEKYQATPQQLDLLSKNWAAVMKKRGAVLEQHPELILAINSLAIYGSNFRTARIDKEMNEMRNEMSDLRRDIEQLKEEKIKAKTTAN